MFDSFTERNRRVQIVCLQTVGYQRAFGAKWGELLLLLLLLFCCPNYVIKATATPKLHVEKPPFLFHWKRSKRCTSTLSFSRRFRLSTLKRENATARHCACAILNNSPMWTGYRCHVTLFWLTSLKCFWSHPSTRIRFHLKTPLWEPFSKTSISSENDHIVPSF